MTHPLGDVLWLLILGSALAGAIIATAGRRAR